MLKKLFRKFREHMLIPEILANQQKILRSQAEIMMGLKFINTISDSEWLKVKSFSPGGFAGDNGLMYTIYRVLNDAKPHSILEFGLGQTSKLIHQYVAASNAEAVTVEHDKKWTDFFVETKTGNYPINTHILPLTEISYDGYKTLTYEGVEVYLKDKKFDFVMVDGPFGSPRFSRSQIIDIAKNNLMPNFCIVIDDYERRGEKDTVKQILIVLDKKGVKYEWKSFSASKDHAVICSKDWEFLCWI